MTDPSLEDATPPAVAGAEVSGAAPATSAGLTLPRRKWIPPVVEMVPTGLEVTAYIAAE
jgi:coenzyme PQQ precursor peptide PqqA